MELEQLVEHVGEAVEVSGVAVILVGLIVSMAVFGARWIAGARDRTNYL